MISNFHLVTGIGVKKAKDLGRRRSGGVGVEYLVSVQAKATRPGGKWSRPQWINSSRLFRSFTDACEVYREAKAQSRANNDKTIAAYAEQIGWNWERRA